jgi:hypothetical protein
MSSSGKKSEPLWASLTSGTVAGAVEGAVTYPADFVKTQVQFHGSKGGKVRRAPSQLLPSWARACSDRVLAQKSSDLTPLAPSRSRRVRLRSSR